jgi:hypothetical protein
LGLDEAGYRQLVATPSRWRPHGGSTRFVLPAGELLERGYRLDRETIRRLKASVDDDVLRDEDGVVSDEQIDRDIDALRRDSQPSPPRRTATRQAQPSQSMTASAARPTSICTSCSPLATPSASP